MAGVKALHFDVYLVMCLKHRLLQSAGRSNIRMQSTRLYSLNPTADDTPWQANKLSASQKIPTCNGTRKLITGFTKAHQWSLFRSNLIQSRLSHTIALRHIFNVFLCHFVIFPSVLPLTFHDQNSVSIYVRSHACFTPRPIYPPCSTYHTIFTIPLTLITLLGPNNPLSNLFSNTLKHCDFWLPPRSRWEVRSSEKW